MLKLILRSACVGVAAVVIATFLAGFISLSLAAMNTPSESGGFEVGWDLVSFAHQTPLWVWLVPLGAFGIGYRYFSKRQDKHTA